MSTEDYCEHCDLPKSMCVHGRPPPPPPPVAAKLPKAPRVVGTKKAAAPARSVPRRWTPPDVFGPEILEVLREAGGELGQDEVYASLEERMAERLTTADHEKTPEGELRWRYAARRSRQALLSEGLMTKGKPGVWSLAD